MKLLNAIVLVLMSFLVNPAHSSEWRKVLNYNQGRSVKREDLKDQSMVKIKDYTNKECSEDEAEAILIGMSWLKFQKGGI